MSFFDDIYEKLFGKSESNKPAVVVNEIIQRSQSFVEKFQEWKASESGAEFLNNIGQSYFWRKQGIDKEPQLVFLESNYSNGFSIDFQPTFGKNDLQYLLDYLADKVKGLDYRLVMSRHTMQEKGDVIQLKEMHYLKPKVGFVEPIDQRYGNVQIEYLEENDEPRRIKLIANSYPDRKYKKADDFEDLAKHILSISNNN